MAREGVEELEVDLGDTLSAGIRLTIIAMSIPDKFERVLSLLTEERDVEDAKFLPHDKVWLRDVKLAGNTHLLWILRN